MMLADPLRCGVIVRPLQQIQQAAEKIQARHSQCKHPERDSPWVDGTTFPRKVDLCCTQETRYTVGESSGSVVESLTRDRRATSLSLTCITALCP